MVLVQVARWENFTAWRCERGAEVGTGGALQFHNFVVLDNEKAGLEMIQVKGGFGVDDGPGKRAGWWLDGLVDIFHVLERKKRGILISIRSGM